MHQTVMNIFRRLRVLYTLRRHPLPYRLWRAVSGRLAILQGLSAAEKARLRLLSALFLQQKRFFGAHGLQVTEAMQLEIALQACLPVLNLDLDLFSDWTHIIVYPGDFLVEHDHTDAIGVVHHQRRELSGESWDNGPLVLSWEEIEADRRYGHYGHNVVIHEIAHKLDMLDGSANGRPPLHYRMHGEEWAAAFGTAFEQLNRHLDHHHDAAIDPYAATSPEEFFAVVSEYFFAAPDILYAQFPQVYRQLALYYRQEPLQRFGPSHRHHAPH